MKKPCAFLIAGALLAGCATEDAARQQKKLDFVASQSNSNSADIRDLWAILNQFCIKESPSGKIVVPSGPFENCHRQSRR